MFKHRAIIEPARYLASAACVAVVCAYVFGGKDWALAIGTRHLSITLLVLLLPHALLPLIAPGRRLFAGIVVAYVAVAAYVWYGYFGAVAADPMNADNRGLTGAILMVSNFAFACGAALRLMAMFVRAFVLRRLMGGANAA
jgi:hypothetical protein